MHLKLQFKHYDTHAMGMLSYSEMERVCRLMGTPQLLYSLMQLDPARVCVACCKNVVVRAHEFW